MSVFEKVQEIFQDVFDDTTLEIKREYSSADIEDWDSLAQINLITQMEKEFNLKFNMNDIIKLQNIGDMIDLIEKKQNEQL
ncbi:TPA: acyl carrier protein [Candidatus Galligastranaerophilus intestinavium]|uniref:Acyl carrier protein n=1 Tax=Candidatus Galligastranaerophilus intestinavium TaxID=2840836 RepID=A0A9D1FJI0_9BACT|nr:acyl carrier protein [Candidatus Galligastranaerophilus intestinavium]